MGAGMTGVVRDQETGQPVISRLDQTVNQKGAGPDSQVYGALPDSLPLGSLAKQRTRKRAGPGSQLKGGMGQIAS
jgi:hypothetical protein